jgi:hypothetical protein
MADLDKLSIQYIVDQRGKKIAVMLPIEAFDELLEDIEDLAVLVERSHELTIPHYEVLALIRTL